MIAFGSVLGIAYQHETLCQVEHGTSLNSVRSVLTDLIHAEDFSVDSTIQFQATIPFWLVCVAGVDQPRKRAISFQPRRLALQLRCLCVLSFRSLSTYLHEGGVTRPVHHGAVTP